MNTLTLREQDLINGYNKISQSFSNTRHAPWPCVVEFIKCIPSGDAILDVGCGNGKNMKIRSDIKITGIDASLQFVRRCTLLGYDVHYGLATNIPFPDDYFDHSFSIAVVHHLDTAIRRKQVLIEMMRVTKPGGMVFVTCWGAALPKTPSARGSAPCTPNAEGGGEAIIAEGVNNNLQLFGEDTFIPFKGISYTDNYSDGYGKNKKHHRHELACNGKDRDQIQAMRFYHLFGEIEFENLFSNCEYNGKVLEKIEIKKEANNYIFLGKIK